LAAWIFWGALALCAYTYGGYLLTLVFVDALASLRATERFLSGSSDRRRPRAEGELPRVSVLIAAHNEASCIREKIENTLALNYPREQLEIWVGSDGSTDGTDAIVGEYASRGVLLSAAPRGGKVAVLNRLAQLARGELWLFTDANTAIERDALRPMVARMRDPKVGCVCGRLRLVSPDGAPAEEGLYWKYENLLKFYESKRGALMGANGGLYLLRRSEWRQLPPDTIVDDFLVTMRVIVEQRALVYAPEAVATEETAADFSGEFKRRVRISAGNFQSLRELSPLLTRWSFEGFAFWSHKMLRWCGPLLLLAAFVANLVLVTRPFYAVLLLGQLALYGAAALSRLGLASGLRGASTAQYFVEMNVAVFMGLLRFVRGTQTATWIPTQRPVARRAA
jgi:cellulose synthase/poly-beta-1,6-N-acetylglucosamine synthase-like glycosyltransferase